MHQCIQSFIGQIFGIELSLLSAAAETSSLIIPLRLATFERSRDSKIGLWIDPFLSIQPRAIRLLKSLSSSSSLLPFSSFGFSSSERLDVTPFLPIELSETTTHRGGSGGAEARVVAATACRIQPFSVGCAIYSSRDFRSRATKTDMWTWDERSRRRKRVLDFFNGCDP